MLIMSKCFGIDILVLFDIEMLWNRYVRTQEHLSFTTHLDFWKFVDKKYFCVDLKNIFENFWDRKFWDRKFWENFNWNPTFSIFRFLKIFNWNPTFFNFSISKKSKIFFKSTLISAAPDELWDLSIHSYHPSMHSEWIQPVPRHCQRAVRRNDLFR